MTERLSRRSFLQATVASTGIALVAGCSGAASSGDGGGESGSGAEPTDSSESDREMPDFDGWFDRTGNYDGVHDMTGQDSVTIAVGGDGNGGGFAFGPAAVRISTGTTVVWEWTGNGGTHNVLHRGGEFESQLTASEGFTFEHTFDETGEYPYVCVPHETIGMVGMVLVE
jgi:halocyanin-like protein